MDKKGEISLMLELDWVGSRARLTPDAEAIVDIEQVRSWTYSELNKRSEAAASWLRKQGVNKGDRVALLAPNHICYFDLLFACMKLGSILFPLIGDWLPTKLIIFCKTARQRLWVITPLLQKR